MKVNKVTEAKLGAMPDTKGINYFEVDKNLPFVIKQYLNRDDYQRALPHLQELGEIAGEQLDELSRKADEETPELYNYNEKGERVEEVKYHPAYEEMKRLAHSQFGLVAMSHRPVLDFPEKADHVLKYAFWYLFVQSEFSLACPMSMTDLAARTINKYGSKELKDKYLSRMISTDIDEMMTGAQFMTEKQGGSDVAANTVMAKEVADHWELWGDKWFCSNVSADVALVLARPEGASSGTKGLGMFLMPRKLDDGSLNNYKINRIKDKFGTRAMASGEVEFEGATAYQVGDVANGFKQMISMVNSSRLSNAIRSTALMRRGFLEALESARGRKAFGEALSQKPLMKETIFELLLDSEAATAITFYTASVFERSDQGSQKYKTLLRIMTPILKGYICKRARYSTAESMEARGGNGYIEDWVNPKLVRDAHVGSIWEGTTNIVALDVIRALEKNKEDTIFFDNIYERIDQFSDPLVQQAGSMLKEFAEKIENQSLKAVNMDRYKRELFAKQLMNRMYHVFAVSLLLQEAEQQIKEDHNYRKLYLGIEYIRRFLISNGSDDFMLNNTSILDCFDTIVDYGEISSELTTELLKDVKADINEKPLQV